MKDIIINGEAVLGIELGSTRIKAVLTNANCTTIIASGVYDWENDFQNGYFTYSEQAIFTGISECYSDLAQNVKNQYGVEISKLKSIGISAMMHGYIALDTAGNMLVPFRTWRNTTTAKASEILTEKFEYNIPQRWSIAHLYQAMLNEESHIADIDYLTTLSGYLHLKLTGEKVLGVGDASGMFPIDIEKSDYNADMVAKFADISGGMDLNKILPKVLVAGESAGVLTEKGAKLLDKSGKLQAGIPLCPPEGDAGTGMVATNSVEVKTGNISAGTSIFAMIVIDKELSKVHPEIDLVTTPSGDLVAMVHCNNCTSDINAWVGLFREFLDTCNIKMSTNDLYTTLFNQALSADNEFSGLMSYNYYSGEPITELDAGVPVFVREITAKFSLANFMKTHLYSAVATLRLGMDILAEENIEIAKIVGHGGFFKTPVVGQQVMADALELDVAVMDNASEGGAWGIAVLASYMSSKAEKQTLSNYLNDVVFAGAKETTLSCNKDSGFATFIEKYKQFIEIEKLASKIV